MERAKGFEPSTQNPQQPANQSVEKCQQSECTRTRAHSAETADSDLLKVVSAWPSLSPPLKAAILAIVGTPNSGEANR